MPNLEASKTMQVPVKEGDRVGDILKLNGKLYKIIRKYDIGGAVTGSNVKGTADVIEVQNNSFQNGRFRALEVIQNKASAVGVKLENAKYFTISEIKDGKHKHQWGEKFDSVEEAKKEIEIYSRAKSNDAQGTTFSIQSSGGTVADVVKK